jgi:hypothetical protein
MVFRLVEKWSFSLCTELRFPLLEACLTNKVRISTVHLNFTKFETEKNNEYLGHSFAYVAHF